MARNFLSHGEDMPSSFKPFTSLTRGLALLLLAHVLVIAAMAASPALHEWIHQDADHEDHDCAVELFIHGGCEGPALMVFLVVPAGFAPALVQNPRTVWVQNLFLSCGRLEHAPPVIS